MKKNILILTVCILTACNKSTEQTTNNTEDAVSVFLKTDLERQSLKGKVKLVRTVRYKGEKNNDNIVKKTPEEICETTIEMYNTEGFLSKKTNTFFYSSSPNSTITYIYDGRGNVLEYIPQSSNSFPSSTIKYTYTYDDKGRAIAYRIHNNYGDAEGYITYDNTNNEVKKKEVRNNHSYLYNERHIITKYDNKGRIIAITMEEKSSSNSHKNEYIYDEKGNVTEEIEWSNVTGKRHFFGYTMYDTQGNWTKRYKIEEGKYYHIYEREIEYY